MSQTSPTEDPHELSDEELLRRIAAKDPEKFPLAKDARRALDQEEDSE